MPRSSPRICIDGFNLAMPRGSGIATYARNLLSSLAGLSYETQILLSSTQPLGKDNLLNQIAIFDDRPAVRSPGLAIAHRLLRSLGTRAVEVKIDGEVITDEITSRFPTAQKVWASHDLFHSANATHSAFRRFTPVKLGAGAAEVMHWTCPLPLVAPGKANIYTLHDLVPLRLPYATLDNKRAYYAMCKTIAARADLVFTVSEHSRRDIIQLLGMDERRVVNTYQAVELPDRYLPRDSDDLAAALESNFGLSPDGYFLFFGALEPKKNLRRVAQAFAAAGLRSPLIVVGEPWANFTTEFLDRFGDFILRYDYLPAEQLRWLVAGAKATLFPSLYEGFGLPVLESMLLGAPVLTSTQGSLPEIAGEGALLVDPYDVDAIRAAIVQLDSDPDLRLELSSRGRRQAAKFSPAVYREKLRDAYARVM